MQVVVFCVFSAELLLIIGYRVWMSTGGVGCILRHVQLCLLCLVSHSFHSVLWPNIVANFETEKCCISFCVWICYRAFGQVDVLGSELVMKIVGDRGTVLLLIISCSASIKQAVQQGQLSLAANVFTWL